MKITEDAVIFKLRDCRHWNAGVCDNLNEPCADVDYCTFRRAVDDPRRVFKLFYEDFQHAHNCQFNDDWSNACPFYRVPEPPYYFAASGIWSCMKYKDRVAAHAHFCGKTQPM